MGTGFQPLTLPPANFSSNSAFVGTGDPKLPRLFCWSKMLISGSSGQKSPPSPAKNKTQMVLSPLNLTPPKTGPMSFPTIKNETCNLKIPLPFTVFTT